MRGALGASNIDGVMPKTWNSRRLRGFPRPRTAGRAQLRDAAARLRSRLRPSGAETPRWAAHVLPLLAAIASLGFEHAEAGILRTAPSANGVSRATASELALRGAGLRRSRVVSEYAARYRIDWNLSAQIYDAAKWAGIDPTLA